MTILRLFHIILHYPDSFHMKLHYITLFRLTILHYPFKFHEIILCYSGWLGQCSVAVKRQNDQSNTYNIQIRFCFWIKRHSYHGASRHDVEKELRGMSWPTDRETQRQTHREIETERERDAETDRDNRDRHKRQTETCEASIKVLSTRHLALGSYFASSPVLSASSSL